MKVAKAARPQFTLQGTKKCAVTCLHTSQMFCLNLTVNVSCMFVPVIIHSLQFGFSISPLKHLVPFAKPFGQHVSCCGFQKYSWWCTFPNLGKVGQECIQTKYRISEKGFGSMFLFQVFGLYLTWNTNGWECNPQSSPISSSKSGEIARVLFIVCKLLSNVQHLTSEQSEFSLWMNVSKVVSSRFPAIVREVLRLSKRKRERQSQTDVQFSNAKLGLGPDFWLFAQQFLISLTSPRLVYIETDPEKMAQPALRHQTSLRPRWECHHNSAKGSWKANRDVS